MKKLIITCALASFGTMVSFAQSSHPSGRATSTVASTSTPEQLAEARAKQLKKDLTLTTEQYTPIYQALLDYYQQEKAAKEAGGPGPGQAMQMQMGLDKRFETALTPAQYTKYSAMPRR